MLKKASFTLDEAFKQYKGEDIIRDAIIQRFEYCVESIWKTSKAYLEYKLYPESPSSPRGVIKLAEKDGIIESASLRFDIIESRNMTSHIYSEKMAIAMFENIKQYQHDIYKLTKKFTLFIKNETSNTKS